MKKKKKKENKDKSDKNSNMLWTNIEVLKYILLLKYIHLYLLTLSQTSPGFYVSAADAF